MKKRICFVLMMAGILMLGGCRSSRHATGDSTSSQQSGRARQLPEIISSVTAKRLDANGVRSKLSMNLSVDGHDVSVGGNLKMKRGEIVQLSLTAFGLMEVGRLELTPEYALLQDRVNKQYVQIFWKDIPDLAAAGIGFEAFQSLFWGELFVPGVQGAPKADDFSMENEPTGILLKARTNAVERPQVAVTFLLDVAKDLLQRTAVMPLRESSLGFKCDYGSWTSLEEKAFPEALALTIKSGSKNFTANMAFSRIQRDETMGDIRTNISSNYRRVAVEDIFRMLGQ